MRLSSGCLVQVLSPLAMSLRSTRVSPQTQLATAGFESFAFAGAKRSRSVVAAADSSAADSGSAADNTLPPATGKKSKAKAVADAPPPPPPPSPPRRTKAKATTPAKRAGPASAATPVIVPPDGWRPMYDLITELRADRTAVVDTMGCEAINESAEPDTRSYQTLISLMLSSQTKDTVNHATMVKLRQHGLSVANILATDYETLHDLIRSVGFHNNKVKYIKETTKILHEQHGGKVPDTMEELLKLPGVGPKMALITLHVAFGKVEGISVDTHVHRICNQLGWAGKGGAKQPEGTRKAIEAWMPREVWPEVNLLLVGLGQEVQTEKAKLLAKCIASSDPLQALRLVETLGVDVAKGLKAAGLEAPEGCVLGERLAGAMVVD